MSEQGAKNYVKSVVSAIVNTDQWARALEYVAMQRAQGRTWKDIAELVTVDNPFSTVSN